MYEKPAYESSAFRYSRTCIACSRDQYFSDTGIASEAAQNSYTIRWPLAGVFGFEHVTQPVDVLYIHSATAADWRRRRRTAADEAGRWRRRAVMAVPWSCTTAAAAAAALPGGGRSGGGGVESLQGH